MSIIEEVRAERERQIRMGYTADHDDEHSSGEISAWAAVYAMPPACRKWDCICDYGRTLEEALMPEGWVFKSGDRRRELIKAAALIVAEIERLDRENERGWK